MTRRLSTTTLVTSLFLAGCSPGPDSKRPAPGDAAPPAVTSQATTTPALPAATREAAASLPDPSPVRLVETSQATQREARLVSAPPVAPDPAAIAATPRPTVIESKATPQPTATKAPPAEAPLPAASRAPKAVDVGGLVEVTATKPGLTRIGSDKCKLCHKVQFESWSKTAHATRTPPLDCESCHGAGSEYKTLAIMKDAKKARAAGMVNPDRAFCAKCHTTGWSDALLQKAHAHKTR